MMASELELLERRERDNPESLTEEDIERLHQLRCYRDSDPEDDGDDDE
jgi:hypothetical protein